MNNEVEAYVGELAQLRAETIKLYGTTLQQAKEIGELRAKLSVIPQGDAAMLPGLEWASGWMRITYADHISLERVEDEISRIEREGKGGDATDTISESQPDISAATGVAHLKNAKEPQGQPDAEHGEGPKGDTVANAAPATEAATGHSRKLEPLGGAMPPTSDERRSLLERAIAVQRSDARTLDEQISDGVKFVLGPGEDEGTRVATDQPAGHGASTKVSISPQMDAAGSRNGVHADHYPEGWRDGKDSDHLAAAQVDSRPASRASGHVGSQPEPASAAGLDDDPLTELERCAASLKNRDLHYDADRLLRALSKLRGLGGPREKEIGAAERTIYDQRTTSVDAERCAMAILRWHEQTKGKS